MVALLYNDREHGMEVCVIVVTNLLYVPSNQGSHYNNQLCYSVPVSKT